MRNVTDARGFDEGSSQPPFQHNRRSCGYVAHMNKTANILSSIALVVSLTSAGAVAATQINGASIKRGSIPADRLTAGARVQLKGQAGPRGFDGLDGQDGAPGLAGPAGLPGVAGSPGAPGGFDPSKVTYVTGPDYVLTPGTTVSMLAPCPAGTTVIGGGFFTSIAHVASSQSYGAGWASIVNNDTGISFNGNAYALCASR